MAPYINDMASPRSPTRAPLAPVPAAAGDGFDDLFDYDMADDVFRDLTPPPVIPTNDNSRKSGAAAGIGIDEEVKVAKKPRAPRVKLDENRLLSQAGIPKLRQRAKDLKFKGKGHEYSDAARLLQFYQFWLDDLFPKARFLDALAMVEKEGHKRRMQTMRMDWINEGRPKPVEEDSLFDMPTLTQPGDPARAQIATRIAPIFENARTDRPTTPAVDEDPDEDLYGATPRASKAQPAVGAAPAQGGSIFGPSKTVISDEPDDDLDALLAEAEMENFSASGTNRSANQHQENEIDDDEMEAMAEMDGMW